LKQTIRSFFCYATHTELTERRAPCTVSVAGPSVVVGHHEYWFAPDCKSERGQLFVSFLLMINTAYCCGLRQLQE